MSQDDGINHRARCEELLRIAEEFEKVEDWDNAVAKYRELNELDHLFQGAESKLLFAVRERECFRNYSEGKALMAEGKYAEAAEALRKAKARAGFYKDTASLIRDCEQHLAQTAVNQLAAPAAARKGCLGALMFL